MRKIKARIQVSTKVDNVSKYKLESPGNTKTAAQSTAYRNIIDVCKYNIYAG
jgi:hypothetical protein